MFGARRKEFPAKISQITAEFGRAGTARRWFAIAAAGALLSLGLPWSSSYYPGIGMVTYSYWSTGLCYNSDDSEGWATTYCDPWLMPPIYQPGAATVYTTTGAEHPARVMLLLTVIALAAGYRRGSAALLTVAPLLAALGLFGFGVTGLAGQLAYAAGLAALLMALHRDGVSAAASGSGGHRRLGADDGSPGIARR